MDLGTPFPHEIIAAFMAHTKSPTQAQLDALVNRSRIPLWALAGAPGTDEFGIGFAEVERQGHSFEFAEWGGEPAILVPGRDLFGDVADIVAWPVKRGDWVACWLGRLMALGEHNILTARLDPALTIHLTPFDWLRDHRHGLVLIDEARAARELRDFGPFMAAGGVEHGERLEALMTLPAPTILVPIETGERHAA